MNKELELNGPYPENYQKIVQQVVKEDETGYLPLLKTKIDIMGKYKLVFIGFPTWNMQMPPPKSYLYQYDLSGKTIIPFNTNAGYGAGNSFRTVKKLCPNSWVLEGFSTRSGVERDGIYFVIKGERGKKDYFTGIVWVKMLLLKDKNNDFSIGNVAFEPCARTNWHTHPKGKVLLVIEGNGSNQYSIL